MDRVKQAVIAATVFLFTLAAAAPAVYAAPHAQFPPDEGIHATKQQVKEIKAFYAELEKALVREDVDKIMSFYAEDYFHRGITKSQVRLLWEDIFRNFDKLSSTHIFSNLTAVDTEAFIVCTGTLLGIPSGSEDIRFVTVDRWFDQNHFISKAKGGSWKIVGGATHWLAESRSLPSGAVEHQLEFHPLY